MLEPIDHIKRMYRDIIEIGNYHNLEFNKNTPLGKMRKELLIFLPNMPQDTVGNLRKYFNKLKNRNE